MNDNQLKWLLYIFAKLQHDDLPDITVMALCMIKNNLLPNTEPPQTSVELEQIREIIDGLSDDKVIESANLIIKMAKENV